MTGIRVGHNKTDTRSHSMSTKEPVRICEKCLRNHWIEPFNYCIMIFELVNRFGVVKKKLLDREKRKKTDTINVIEATELTPFI